MTLTLDHRNPSRVQASQQAHDGSSTCETASTTGQTTDTLTPVVQEMEEASSSTASTTRESSWADATSRIELSVVDRTSNTSAGTGLSTGPSWHACCPAACWPSLLAVLGCCAPVAVARRGSLPSACSAAAASAVLHSLLALPAAPAASAALSSLPALAFPCRLSSTLQLTLWPKVGTLPAPSVGGAPLPQVLVGALLVTLLASPVLVGLLVLLLLPLCLCFEDEAFLLMTDAMAEAALAKLSTPWLTFRPTSPDDLLLLLPLRFTPRIFPLFAALPWGDLLLEDTAPPAAPAAAAELPGSALLNERAGAAAVLLSSSVQGAGGLATNSFSLLTMNQPFPPVCTAQTHIAAPVNNCKSTCADAGNRIITRRQMIHRASLFWLPTCMLSSWLAASSTSADS